MPRYLLYVFFKKFENEVRNMKGTSFHRIYFSNFQVTLIRETFTRAKNRNFLDKLSQIE